MKKRYFGKYPVVNILLSKLLFAGLRYRRWQLKRKFSNKAYPVKLENTEKTREEFQSYLDKGYRKLNLGGGQKSFKGFVNIDFLKHDMVEREVVANILDLSFIPDNSLEHIHSNHVVEHITQEQLQEQLREYKRILVPGGRMSIRCPNALGVSFGFFFGQQAEKEHEKFLKLGYPEEEDFYNKDDGWYHKDLWGLYHWFYAYSGNVENQHLNIITPTKIKETINEAGFKILAQTAPETSNIVVVAETPSP